MATPIFSQPPVKIGCSEYELSTIKRNMGAADQRVESGTRIYGQYAQTMWANVKTGKNWVNSALGSEQDNSPLWQKLNSKLQLFAWYLFFHRQVFWAPFYPLKWTNCSTKLLKIYNFGAQSEFFADNSKYFQALRKYQVQAAAPILNVKVNPIEKPHSVLNVLLLK